MIAPTTQPTPASSVLSYEHPILRGIKPDKSEKLSGKNGPKTGVRPTLEDYSTFKVSCTHSHLGSLLFLSFFLADQTLIMCLPPLPPLPTCMVGS